MWTEVTLHVMECQECLYTPRRCVLATSSVASSLPTSGVCTAHVQSGVSYGSTGQQYGCVHDRVVQQYGCVHDR